MLALRMAGGGGFGFKVDISRAFGSKDGIWQM